MASKDKMDKALSNDAKTCWGSVIVIIFLKYLKISKWLLFYMDRYFIVTITRITISLKQFLT